MLYFIGTGGGGSPGSRRWRASTLLELKDSIILIDCGAGCHYRLSDKGYLTDIDAVLITHMHMDHFLGLPELLFQAHMDGRRKDLLIYAPKGLEEFIKVSAPHLYTSINFKFAVRAIQKNMSFSINGSEVKVVEACHRIEGYGFKIRSKDGLAIGFSGDTSEPCRPLLEGFRKLDVLVHEATCSKKYEDVCHKYAHTTNEEAVETAIKLGAKTLILNHIDEFFNPDVRQEINLLRNKFDGRILIPNDQDIVII